MIKLALLRRRKVCVIKKVSSEQSWAENRGIVYTHTSSFMCRYPIFRLPRLWNVSQVRADEKWKWFEMRILQYRE